MSYFTESLDQGDFVIVGGCGFGNSDQVGKVERFTKTQIILEGGGRYRRNDGFMVGASGWDRSRLQKYTEEKALEIQHQRLVKEITYKATKTNLKELNITQLITIWDLLK